MSDRRLEAAGIWWTHGPADAATTIAASRIAGINAEANPIVARLLHIGEAHTAITMIACVAVASALWPTAANAIDAPPAVAGVITTIGLIVSANNLVVMLL